MFFDKDTVRVLRRTRRNLRRTTKILQRNARLFAEVVPAPIIFDAIKLLEDDSLVWTEFEAIRKPLAALVREVMLYPLLRPELVKFCQALFDAPTDSLVDDLGL